MNVSDNFLLPQTGSRDRYLSINGIARDTWSPLRHTAEKVEVKIPVSDLALLLPVLAAARFGNRYMSVFRGKLFGFGIYF